MTPRTAWRWCAVAGVAAFFCSWLFGRIPGLVACGPTGGSSPIIAFELARSPAEVAALFGAEPCRSVFAGAQRTALLVDGLGFIPAYTAFLVLAVCAATVRPRWPLVACPLVPGLCDEIEGGLLYAILRDLPGTSALLSALFWEVHVKFALLALGTLMIGLTLLLKLLLAQRIVGVCFGLAIAMSAGRALYGLVTLPSTQMMTGFTHAWVTLLLAAITASVWPSLFGGARSPAATPGDAQQRPATPTA